MTGTPCGVYRGDVVDACRFLRGEPGVSAHTGATAGRNLRRDAWAELVEALAP